MLKVYLRMVVEVVEVADVARREQLVEVEVLEQLIQENQADDLTCKCKKQNNICCEHTLTHNVTKEGTPFWRTSILPGPKMCNGIKGSLLQPVDL